MFCDRSQSYRRQLSARQFFVVVGGYALQPRWHDGQHWDLQFPIPAAVGFVGAEIEIVR